MDTSDNGMGTAKTPAQERLRRAGQRARELRQTAMQTAQNQPVWVWAALGGIVLLLIGGVFAVTRVRSRRTYRYETHR